MVLDWVLLQTSLQKKKVQTDRFDTKAFHITASAEVKPYFTFSKESVSLGLRTSTAG